MSIQVNYTNVSTKKNSSNLVLFVDEKFNVSNLKKHISNSEHSYISDLLNNKDKKLKTKTLYKIISYNKKTSLIMFEPKTGKKHQLRIVAKKLGCPIVGDLKYNLNKTNHNENLKLSVLISFECFLIILDCF